jgi:hypothetical protein
VISYLLADSVYCGEYKADLSALVAGDTGLLVPSVLKARINAQASLVSSWQSGTALSAVLDFAASRKAQLDTTISNHTCP